MAFEVVGRQVPDIEAAIADMAQKQTRAELSEQARGSNRAR